MFRYLSCVLMLGFSIPVCAVERSSDGYGQVLLVPYFAALEQLSTLVSITPTVSRWDIYELPRAISVSVHLLAEDAGGTPTRKDFTVVLPPNASWNFALARADSGTVLHASGRACVFARDGLVDASALPLQGGSEGWVEAYALGEVTLSTLRFHMEQGDCGAVGNSIASLNAADWLAAPRNELRGTAHLVDVPSGSSFSMPLVALSDFRDAPFWSGFGQSPELADVRPAVAVVRTADGTRRVSTFATHPVDAVSAVLTDTQWEVDFTIEPGLSAQTDLVILAPTRPWYVQAERQRAPFIDNHRPWEDPGVTTAGRLHDRDGQVNSTPASAKCSPPAVLVPQRGPSIRDALVVAQFGRTGLLQSARAFTLVHRGLGGAACVTDEVPLWQRMQSGRLALSFASPLADDTARLVSDEGHEFIGLPVIGAAFSKAVSNDTPLLRASFGLVQPIARQTDYR